jgi:hypothetical protein
MKTTIPLFCINRLALLSVSASALVFLGWNVHEKIAPAFSGPVTANAPFSEVAPQRLPFGFDDVVRYFEDALGYHAQERFPNRVVFHGGSSRDEFYTITVTQRAPDLLVNFNVVDDYGMQIVREFFEAPFFLRFESEQFYSLLNGRAVTRALHMSRFDLLFQYSSPGFEANIDMTFSPRSRSLSVPDGPARNE